MKAGQTEELTEPEEGAEKPAKGADVIDLMSLLKKSVEKKPKPAKRSSAQTARRLMPKRQIRYAVVGLGHIAQVAVLPAFGNARRNSKLVALVSGDPVKREQLGKKYDVEHTYSYEQYDECLQVGHRRGVHRAAEHACTASTPCAPRAPASTCCSRSRWR